MTNIKSILFLVIVYLTLSLNTSCKNECDSVVCENGGNCIEGSCDCPEGFIGRNCQEIDPSQIQSLLDENKLPLDLVNDNIPLDSLYGKRYQGGLIFYLNTTTGNGLVAAPEDQSTNAAWGCLNVELEGADGEAVGTGAENTQDIVAGCLENGIAAQICNELVLNGYSDWYLPSRVELRLIWKNVADSDGDGFNAGLDDSGNLGGFYDYLYWCSTEVGPNRARVVHFKNGSESNTTKKDQSFHVRAIRAF